MPLWLAVVILLAAVAGIILVNKFLSESRVIRAVCIIICALIALTCTVYIGLTAIFIDAARNK